MDWKQGLNDAWASVATAAPKFGVFLLILIVGWFIARLIAKVVDTVLERVGFDRAVERGGLARALERSKYDASDLIAKLLYYAILLITLQVAFGVFGPNPISELLDGVVAWLPKAAVAIVIIVVAGAIAAAVKDIVTGALAGMSYGRLVGTIASVAIWVLGVVAALEQIGVATKVSQTVLIALLATVGGILVVGVGGGMIKPMQGRWDNWLSKAEHEASGNGHRVHTHSSR